MAKQYKVIAGAVPALRKKKKDIKMGDLLPESFFTDGAEIGELIKEGFIVDAGDDSAASQEDGDTNEKKSGKK